MLSLFFRKIRLDMQCNAPVHTKPVSSAQRTHHNMHLTVLAQLCDNNRIDNVYYKRNGHSTNYVCNTTPVYMQ